MQRVDYDRVAPVYDRRYQTGLPYDIESVLRQLAQRGGRCRILEVGCGTGQWLTVVPPEAEVLGLDLSAEMLRHAADREDKWGLIQADANQLPFIEGTFDLVYCVHALHHFAGPGRFIRDSKRILRQGGVLALIGMDPSRGLDHWYLYDYFPGTYAIDVSRYPSAEQVQYWLAEAGYHNIVCWTVCRLQAIYRGQEVFTDPILHKDGTSQLSLLSDEAFRTGMNHIERTVRAAEVSRAELPEFEMDIHLRIAVGCVADHQH